MARPREYDEDEVLDRALHLFWERGYEATSLSDLMEATGLAKGSVYKGFGDKKSFFLRTLDRYLEQGRAGYRAIERAHPDAVDTLRAWMLASVELTMCGAVRKGCFAVNCVVELAPHDADVRARIKEHNQRLTSYYVETIRRGMKDGSLRADLDPADAARWLGTVISGVAVASKTGLTAAQASSMVELGLRALIA